MWNDLQKEDFQASRTKQRLQLLNVGCGNHFHCEWVNIDLVPKSREVIAHDLANGLPFPAEHFDVVYHSHVLEHLNPNAGFQLLEECFRVLKPSGILRIVVPDLERIAELYLQMHDRAWEGDEDAKTDYAWMKLELLDQLVREHSGGQMGQYLSDPAIKNSDFVQSRVGDEFRRCTNRPARQENGSSRSTILPSDGNRRHSQNRRRTRRFREWAVGKLVRLFMGRVAENAFREGLFRYSGEIHRWMYDRYSLREICNEIGFDDFKIVSATESQITGFQSYGLDVVGREIRKPDSLFVECRKPGMDW